jgi:hypothetical protein
MEVELYRRFALVNGRVGKSGILARFQPAQALAVADYLILEPQWVIAVWERETSESTDHRH